MTSLEALISRLRESLEYGGQISHYRYLPAAEPQWREAGDFVPPAVLPLLQAAGIRRLYSHQAEALAALRQGAHVGVTTPTASGKTLIYNLAVLAKLLEDPQAHALYIFPLKALAQDQLKTLNQLIAHTGSADLSSAIYDGDTSASLRAKLKRRLPRILITNPDMLHYGFLGFPDAWRAFFRNLQYVVLDEAHSYRGIFGSHVSLVLRRLRRLCGEPGPKFIASSATMANAGEFLQRLAGVPFTLVESNGAPRQGRHVLLMEPTGSPYSLAAGLLQECLNHDVKTIVFTKSRKITELVTLWVQEGSPEHARRIAAYRSGYLPEERREIERRLFADELGAVISTSALESGIDVGGLDACILTGYPGTMISTWQRVGRAGRQQREALVILIALPDALDHYFLRQPDAFFSGRFENCVLDPDNTQVLAAHLPCAAAEEPLRRQDLEFFGPAAAALVPALVQRGVLHESAQGGTWFSPRKQPHRDVDIRSAGEQFAIKVEPAGKLLGTIDTARVYKECHPGAIYLHAGVSFEVSTLDVNSRTVLVREADVDWYTQYTASEEVEILDLLPGQSVRASAQEFSAGLVRVRVTERVVAYERRRVRDRSLLSEHDLNLPPRVFETQALLLTVPDLWRRRALDFSLDFAGGLHAAEHVLIASLPVHVICERWDLGGLSTVFHPQADQPCIFIYDGYPGGVGLAAKGLEVLPAWLATAKDMITQCDCEAGCPACIHSPKCGSRNQPLDKQACEMLLRGAAQRVPETFAVAGAPGTRPLLPPPAPPVPLLPAPQPRETVPRAPLLPGFRLLVFDLETQRSAADVGGWGNSDRMGISLAVIYDQAADTYTTYREENVPDMVQNLLAADLVVGFNIDGFDLKVLSAYTPYAGRIRTFDILGDIYGRLGYKLSLDHLALVTLGRGKVAEGLAAIEWFRQGNWADLERYCRSDVEITRDLLWFGIRYGYLLYERQGQVLKLPVEWRSRFPGPDPGKA